ncbi:Lrp/AsnC family transcriptional regulator [Tsukamurella paurometabola]|uniref:Leucine-responsive regulatory protein n=1 Tax=Tsukamurella paurometabola TaxID=2061 RepID=A0A3P8KIT5_TSUPA|nr:Lrp/AsnC family transcriptional regulator [Tsukamurella paurometabola]MBS4100030.1 Lrp/AsnC family transcriptional regulator [Tsukamurella paurometabola]UEA83187.1 Lrp/AsnC family transcriptional regulator [Tsukamurella paurometabola]VDR40278.1 Leucine-responsive regulatory protein [Tsukamurella paurometabola]
MADGTEHPGLDDFDRRILQVLAEDGRISMRALAERVHVSRANAYVRVERLERSGVIRGYAARVDHERAGFGTSAYIGLSIRQDAWQGVAEHLRELPYVEHFALVGGDFDVIVLVRTPDNAALRDVVLVRLQALGGVRSTRTWLIFDEADGPGALGPHDPGAVG